MPETTERVRAFLDDLEKVCQKHRLSLSHQDKHGAFVVEKYDKELSTWLGEASAGDSLEDS